MTARVVGRAVTRIWQRLPQRGWVAEWFKAAVLKTAVGVTLPWVRIPPHPPIGSAHRVREGGRRIAGQQRLTRAPGAFPGAAEIRGAQSHGRRGGTRAKRGHVMAQDAA